MLLPTGQPGRREGTESPEPGGSPSWVSRPPGMGTHTEGRGAARPPGEGRKWGEAQSWRSAEDRDSHSRTEGFPNSPQHLMFLSIMGTSSPESLTNFPSSLLIDTVAHWMWPRELSAVATAGHGVQEETPASCLRSATLSPSDACAACDWPCWARRAVCDQHWDRRFFKYLFVFLGT